MGNSERRATGVAIETAGSEAHPPDPQPLDATERLTIELARLRAKFGADPAIARASLDDAWMSPTAAMEEDEAEFIDAVADCLGVGLSLDAALACWDSGGLLYDDEREADLDDADDGAGGALPEALSAQHHLHAGRRHLVP